MTISRRAVLGVGAAALTGAAVRPREGPAPADWAALDASIDGDVETPGAAGYDVARQLNDPRFDEVRPPAVARCVSSADVSEVVRFARRMRIPVVTRGGGHSYVGASVAAAGVVIDLRGIEEVRADRGSATAEIGGGARLGDVYERLGAAGLAIPSGSCGSVGIGGVTLGGGIGMGASAYGLTCDAVTGAEVVGADGRVRSVDAGRERDLFWALRGGGGGQFGVVTRWRMRAYRTGTVGTFVLTYPWTDARRVAAGWQERLLKAGDETWSACQFASDDRGRLSVRINGVVFDGDPADEAAEIARAVGREPATTKLDSRPHLDVLRDRAGEADRATELVGSEIFRHVLPAAGIAALLAVVERRARDGRPGLAKFKRMTGAVGRVNPAATAFPWRGVHTMLQWLVTPGASDAATVRDGYAWIESGHRAVRKWSAGRYVNYLEPSPAVLPRYYGANFARLRWIRTAADPHGLFRSPYAL
ncbi:FAD-binding oxidoreductase [Actinoplanes sp. NPDC051861]|uniref:FAD-binding oxidoreductase n=1 Tax=Actinoplanes sp. NPDC051861 TaxID=3155170 RepID=UPI003440098E